MSPHVHTASIAMRGKRCTDAGAPVDITVAALAEKQFGVVARKQLLALGVSTGWIERRLARGYLLRLHRGVYAVGHKRLDRRGRLLAAVFACGSRAVLSHRSAGEVLGFLSSSTATPEVTRPTAWRCRTGIVVHRAPVPEDEFQVVEGIPVTGLSRTVFDLASSSSRSQVEQMLNEAEIRGLTDRVSIPMLLERYPRRAGGVLLRRILADRTNTGGITRKELERRFKKIIGASDLPRPQHNAHVAVNGHFFEVDCLWSRQRLIVELDGRAVHGTGLAFERDRRRDRLLMVDGWQVTRVTWLQLRDEGPAVVADLRRLLSRAEP